MAVFQRYVLPRNGGENRDTRVRVAALRGGGDGQRSYVTSGDPMDASGMKLRLPSYALRHEFQAPSKLRLQQTAEPASGIYRCTNSAACIK